MYGNNWVLCQGSRSREVTLIYRVVCEARFHRISKLIKQNMTNNCYNQQSHKLYVARYLFIQLREQWYQ